MSAVDTAELLRTALAFQRTWVETGAEVRKASFGAIVRDLRYPLIHMANLAWVERMPAEGVSAILEALDAAFAGTEVRHRHVVFDDARVAFENQEAFAARGLRPLADLTMARLGLPACLTTPDLTIREVGKGAPDDDYRRMRLRLFEGLGYGTEEARQLRAFVKERGGRIGVREFVGYYRGEPAATASLWTRGRFGFLNDVATMPEFRNRGIGRTMIFEISKESLNAGCEYSLLFTDPFDSPQAMYQSLGYQPVGEVRSFLKAAEAGSA